MKLSPKQKSLGWGVAITFLKITDWGPLNGVWEWRRNVQNLTEYREELPKQ